MIITFTWDDGPLEDLRLFEMHRKHSIPGMFFVPTANREGRAVLNQEMLRSNESEFITFGGHTQNHVYLTELNAEEAFEEVCKNKLYLEDTLGHEVEHFCLPGGRFNQDTLTAVRKAGYKTVRYADPMHFKSTHEEIQCSLHLYDRGLKSLVGHAVLNYQFDAAFCLLAGAQRDYFTQIKRILAVEARKRDSQVLFWGHGWEIEENNLWANVEDLFNYISINYRGCIRNYGDFCKALF